jgi:hypothetical protein
MHYMQNQPHTACRTSQTQQASRTANMQAVTLSMKDQPNAAYGTMQPKAVYRTSNAHAKFCSRTQHAWPTSYNMQDQPIAILGIKKNSYDHFKLTREGSTEPAAWTVSAVKMQMLDLVGKNRHQMGTPCNTAQVARKQRRRLL